MNVTGQAEVGIWSRNPHGNTMVKYRKAILRPLKLFSVAMLVFFPDTDLRVPQFLFRCVRQERISIRGSVCPSVGLSICWSIHWLVSPLRLCKKHVSRLFLATVRSYTKTNDQPTCWVFSPVYSSICLSHTYVTWSIHTESQPGRIVARSGLFSSCEAKESCKGCRGSYCW